MPEIKQCEFLRIEQHLESRWYTEKEGALVVPESVRDFSDVEAVMQNDTAPDREQRGQENRETTRVIHGRVDLNPVRRPQLPGEDRSASVKCNLPVRNHYTFWSSRGAAGVEQAENVLGL